MDDCNNACEWGDDEVDSDNDGGAYDGGLCKCTKCPNFLFCHTWTPNNMCGGCKVDLCSQVLVVCEETECPVCLEVGTCVKYPAGCHHAICPACLAGTRDMSSSGPDPADYGLVRDCECVGEGACWGTHTCGDCHRQVEDWEATESGVIWIEACMDHDSESSRMTCPVCRRGVAAPVR
jgi:hypothetical protein